LGQTFLTCIGTAPVSRAFLVQTREEIMVLEHPEKAAAGRRGIDVTQEHECRYWAQRFDISPDDLKQAVMVAGPMPHDLARYFGKSADIEPATSFEPGPLEKAQRATDFVTAKAQEARRLAERTTDDVMKFIGARPVASVLIGAAAGYLLGWIAAGAVRQRFQDRRTTRAIRSAPLERERLVQPREWPRTNRSRASV
jgi:hypothetical protein